MTFFPVISFLTIIFLNKFPSLVDLKTVKDINLIIMNCTVEG